MAQLRRWPGIDGMKAIKLYLGLDVHEDSITLGIARRIKQLQVLCVVAAPSQARGLPGARAKPR